MGGLRKTALVGWSLGQDINLESRAANHSIATLGKPIYVSAFRYANNTSLLVQSSKVLVSGEYRFIMREVTFWIVYHPQAAPDSCFSAPKD
jgi:hypothetical protein